MKLNDSEWTVMRAIWALGPDGVTAREVHDEVEGATDWSYSTVRTLLTRLAEKGALGESKDGKQLVYTGRIEQGDARRSALRSLVDTAFGGRIGSLVQHLAEAESLSPSERAELEAMLEGDPSTRPKRKRRSR